MDSIRELRLYESYPPLRGSPSLGKGRKILKSVWYKWTYVLIQEKIKIHKTLIISNNLPNINQNQVKNDEQRNAMCPLERKK